MTPDVIYPSRKFVLPIIRHSPRDIRRFTTNRSPRIIARSRETSPPPRRRYRHRRGVFRVFV